ncbi:hypothetical protein [Azotobacter armeniacus]
MDGIVDHALKPLWKGLYLVRLVLWLVFEMLFEVVAGWVGWCICRVLSLNSFPKEQIGEYEKASRPVAMSACLAGMVSLLVLGAALAFVDGVGAT